MVAEERKQRTWALAITVLFIVYCLFLRTLQWVRSAAPIIIHINLDKVLQFLVKDTHYRNQFETGTSGGSTDLKARRSWEVRTESMKSVKLCIQQAACFCKGRQVIHQRALDSRTRATFNVKFSCLFSKNRHGAKLHCTFFSPQKLARLFPLKEIKPSPDRLMITFLTFDNLFLPQRLSR